MAPLAVRLGALEIMVGVWFWGADGHVVDVPLGFAMFSLLPHECHESLQGSLRLLLGRFHESSVPAAQLTLPEAADIGELRIGGRLGGCARNARLGL